MLIFKFRLFKIESALFILAFFFNLLYVPFSIGLRYEITGSFIGIDIIVIIITFIDSFLRPFLAISK